MATWIEFGTDLHNHWKIERLRLLLGIRYAEALGLMAALWAWSGKYAENGNLSRFTEAEIEAAARYERQETATCSLVDALKEANLLEIKGRQKKLHDWHKHGLRILNNARKRMQDKRNRDKHVTLPLRNKNVTVTPRERNCNVLLSSLSLLKENKEKPTQASAILPKVPDDLKANELDLINWLTYKRERGQTYKPTGLEALWRRVRAIAQPQRKLAIETAMSNNWSGIFDGANKAGRPGLAHESERPKNILSLTPEEKERIRKLEAEP